MALRLTVWLFGTEAAPEIAGDQIQIATEPARPIGNASAGDLAQRVAGSGAELVGFAGAGGVIPEEALSQAIRVLDDQPRVAGVILSADHPVVRRNRWERFPLLVAALMEPPGLDTAIIVRRGEFDSAPLPHTASPLWHWLIRALRGGREFTVIPQASNEHRTTGSSFLPDLAPRSPDRENAWLAEHLTSLRPEDLVGHVQSQPDALAVKAGLFQLHDDLDESHSISQSIEGRGRRQAGDYWHAIMHRREPDDSNAKYWFRQVGRHPVYAQLAERAAAILDTCPSAAAKLWRGKLVASGGWDPFAFVDLCSQCRRGGDDDLTRAAQEIQLAEMWLLLEQTIRDAQGGGSQ